MDFLIRIEEMHSLTQMEITYLIFKNTSFALIHLFLMRWTFMNTIHRHPSAQFMRN